MNGTFREGNILAQSNPAQRYTPSCALEKKLRQLTLRGTYWFICSSYALRNSQIKRLRFKRWSSAVIEKMSTAGFFGVCHLFLEWNLN